MKAWISMIATAVLGVSGLLAADSELPFAAEVAIEDFEAYRADIAKKAAAAIGSKREQTIAKLEAEAAKQSKSSNAAAATAILKVVADMRAEVEAEKKAAELAARRWTPLFEPENLPVTWVMPKEPDGGWSYTGGELEMQSLMKFAPVLHEAPEGDLVMRAKVKLDPNGEGEKENQAGIGFFATGDKVLAAIAQAPGLILAFGTDGGGGGPLVKTEKSTACQKKFTALQVARVGNRFLVFARGKLLHDCDVKVARGKGSVALLANNAKGHFKDVEIRTPDADDLERLKSGKPVQ